MSVNWTKEQQNVIDFRNRNILVSAAAGSGKTAVLVERIIKKITDAKQPVDIDRLLVVTFTKAAAAEMRERIADAIDKLREEHPEDENLSRQLTLIHNAQIATIDSFCLYVVRNHFQEIQLDPNFRIADTGEIKLLEMDALKALFEANYEEKENKAFFELVDTYSKSRNDQAVKDMVSKIYHLSASNPWPKEWIANLAAPYQVASQKELLETTIMKEIAEYAKEMVLDAAESVKKLQEIASMPDGPDKYFETLVLDFESLNKICDCDSYEEIYAFFNKLSFTKLPPIRNFTGDDAKKDRVQKGRNSIKADVEEIRNKYFATSTEELLEQMRRMRPAVEEIVRLSLSYYDLMQSKKRDKRIVDFSDIEHFALNILIDENTKEIRKTAEEFQDYFDEIMIDEYQDSNQVQEEIMCAISKMKQGKYNMFMVGDVKQSIYRFRLARPELFMEKYESYQETEAKEQRIDLHQNFRSRKEVVECVNDIFYKIMQPDLGKVAYDDAAALYHGATYPESDDMKAEILIFDQSEDVVEDAEGLINKQLEARTVADKIRYMMEHQMVTDKKTRELRPIRYSDIVILFRSLKGWGTDFAQILQECGIPAHVESSTGYFSAIEVQTVLHMLRILDNPYQDVSLAAVLKSPMVGLDNEELAELRLYDDSKSFAISAIRCCKEQTEGKLADFWKKYNILRDAVSDTPVHEMIQMVLDVTGYGDYASSLPAGAKRRANLQMLYEKAIAYESTSYKGLFHFVRYIDQLQKYEEDFGEADITGENEDVVHIMTIHKSKGLEFPVVFVSGINKQFNQMDTRESFVLHPDLGIGMFEMQKEPKIKRPCFFRDAICSRITRENLGEELRVLYVALTRAKEKLILTGSVKDAQKTMGQYVGNINPKEPLSFGQRMRANSYMDWIIPAVISYMDKYEIQYVTPEKMVMDEAQNQAEKYLEYQTQMKQIENASDELVNQMKATFAYVYPYQSDAGKKSKYSVSELKHDSMVQKYDRLEGEMAIPDFLEEEIEHYIPQFMLDESGDASEKELSSGIHPGALRGTAVHRVMECMDFAPVEELQNSSFEHLKSYVVNEIEKMRQNAKITEEMYARLPISMVESFMNSTVALRMSKAMQKGSLFREKPFVMDYQGALLQGIIDAFWIEDNPDVQGNRIVLLDYKTDRVTTAKELQVRYSKQMELYADALSRLFTSKDGKKPEVECLIYSLHLQEVISL